MNSQLQQSVDEWLRLDKNEETRAEVQDLLANNEFDEIGRRFRHRIEFGTAGLRSRMEAGWSRMNDLIVIQTSQGLCAYTEKKVDNATERGVVIGYDHRYNSRRWAELAAAAFINRGFRVYLHNRIVHTPLVPFSVSALNAAIGIMITASHNPKQDNGYKVYWENGVQIISPHDIGIASEILSNLEPHYWEADIQLKSPLCINKVDEMEKAYFSYLSSLALPKIFNTNSAVKFVQTSLHGVGNSFAVKAFETFGLPAFIPVEAQKNPDPEFPTVVFPNPEENGALDLAIEKANDVGASYVLAQDPDADRFSAAEKDFSGKWHLFTGDELGTIFAARILERFKSVKKPLNRLAMVASTVSSKMLESMATVEGFKFVETLTGFKYIGNACLQLVTEGYEVPFAYEEAIGFMIGSRIRDKDGIVAMAVFAELAIELYDKGYTVSSYLQEQYAKYGYFKTRNSYYICKDPEIIDKIFERLRNFEKDKKSLVNRNYPSTLANMSITSIKDLSSGYDSSNPPSYKSKLPVSSGHMIQFKAKSDSSNTGVVLTVRTSGTEPKIKYYLEAQGADPDSIDQILSHVVYELEDKWLEISKYNLGRPWGAI